MSTDAIALAVLLAGIAVVAAIAAFGARPSKEEPSADVPVYSTRMPLGTPYPTVYFSGVAAENKAEVAPDAMLMGVHIVAKLTPQTTMLCIGKRPNAIRIQEAVAFGVPIVTWLGFVTYMSVIAQDVRRAHQITGSSRFPPDIDTFVYPDIRQFVALR